jgi:peptide/nickel transport system permease protein
MKKSQWIPGVVGIVILSVIVLFSILAPWLAPFDPNEINIADSLQGPSLVHLFGTDILGRDLFSRILYGGRSSMVLALFATILSMLFGMLVGAFAGYFGGMTDYLLTICTNIFQGLPGTSLMVAIAGIMGPSFRSLILALILTSWTGFSRIVRTEVMKYREENFVEGLKSIGESDFAIMFRHIIPNMMGNVMVLFTTRIGRCLLSLSGLSYLGLGIQPPDPDWSVMLSDARMNFRSAPHLVLVPGICIVLLLFSINLIGDMLRDWLDKQNREAGGIL